MVIVRGEFWWEQKLLFVVQAFVVFGWWDLQEQSMARSVALRMCFGGKCPVMWDLSSEQVLVDAFKLDAAA